MQASKFQTTQAPLRERYRNDAPAARLTLKARGTPGEDTITCKVETGKGLAVAGIHPKAGGSGLELCSGDMLLEALVACAGVSLKAAATMLDLRIESAVVTGRRRRGSARNAGRLRGCAGRLRGNPPAVRRRDRCAGGKARPAARARRALLRGVPDAQPQPEDGCALERHAGCFVHRRPPSIVRRVCRGGEE